ncbi:MAG: Nif11-like leader peptide family natural product precursor [Mojavia pulchra JT2-VF2]|jgi:predicted ribosomally synthesized peptide with nif11-like leader|uniref:Nif11-like leader peptide family natural product n=1 Tax=Mojavia pulchra JT2-VF2 TaxID=287848 RepID=A0A951PZZ7_9NOST|nr:Nif11-like leader peptide family natural product precursor [Mojavia pulchra JT2-VF2]
MSKQNVEQFYIVVENNQQLQEQLGQADNPQSFYDMAARLGQENGYSFTAQEAEDFTNQRVQQGNAELSDQNLEAVAGGRSCPMDTRFTFCVFISSCWGSKC